MKFFVSFVMIAAVTANPPADPKLNSRITGGTAASANYVPSFVLMNIQFDAYNRTCGGLLAIPGDRIITAASCLTNNKADTISYEIKFSFGQSSDFSQFYSGDFDIYISPTFRRSSNIFIGDIAVIVFQKVIPQTTSITAGVYDTNNVQDTYLGQSLIVCGFGVLDNQRTRPTALQCTSIPVTTAKACANASTFANVQYSGVAVDITKISPLPGVICLKGSDDKNACSGDFGAPVYSNATGTLVPVGVVSSYPDSNINARCQDGHFVQVSQIGFYSTNFIPNPAGGKV